MRNISGLIFAMLLLQIFPVQAATEVELVNERTVDGQTSSFIINGLYQNDHSRFTMHDPDVSATGAGIYVLSNDGGKTAFYVDTNENICHRWTHEEFTQTLSAFLLESSGKFNVNVSDLKFVKLLEEPSESMHGLPTTLARYTLSFNASYKYAFFKGRYILERQADYWTTPNIESINAPISLFQNIGQRTGKEQIDRELSDAFGSNSGFRMRSEILQTRTDKKEKQLFS
jgi:hypothetical protein